MQQQGDGGGECPLRRPSGTAKTGGEGSVQARQNRGKKERERERSERVSSLYMTGLAFGPWDSISMEEYRTPVKNRVVEKTLMPMSLSIHQCHGRVSFVILSRQLARKQRIY